MSLLFATSMEGPWGSEHPLIDFDPDAQGYTDFSAPTADQQEEFHNWGLWNEDTLTDLADAWVGRTRYKTPGGVLDTVGVQFPITIRSSKVTWGLKNTLIAGIAFSDRDIAFASNTLNLRQMRLLSFWDDAQGEQISVWLLVEEEAATSSTGYMFSAKLEVRRGATVLFTSGNILPHGIGSAEFGLDDIPANFQLMSYYTQLDGYTYGNAWHFVEFKAVIDPVAGSYELRLNGTVLSQDVGPINTAEQGTAGADNLRWAAGMTTATAAGNTRTSVWIQEVYLCDNVGAAPLNDFLGRIQVHEKYANGQGFSSEWLPSSGAALHNTYVTHLHSVNDTTWLESSTPGDTELFTYSNLPRNMQDNLLAVMVVLRGALSVGGDRDVSPVYRTGAANYVHPDFMRVTGPVYESEYFFWDVNPNTLAGWTRADIEGQELGFTLIA